MTQPLQVADPAQALQELPPVPAQGAPQAKVAANPEAVVSTAQTVGLVDIQGPQLGWGNTNISVELNGLSLLIGVAAGFFLAIFLGKA